MCQKQPCLFIAQPGETLQGEYRRSTARTAGECQMLLLLLLLMVWAPLPIHPQILVEDDRCNQTDWQRNPEGVSDKKSHLLNVSVSNQGRSNSLFLTWEKLPRGVQNVSLALFKFDTSTVLQNGSAGLNATSFLFEGLLPGTQYNIEVTVLLICTQNSSRRVTGRTVPGPVRNVVLSHDSPSVLLASWSEATGGKDAYQLVLYHIKSQTAVKNVTISKSATTYSFEKLLNGSEYALQITTLAGPYKASTIARHWTAPVVPEALIFQNSGSSSNLTASWSNAGGAEWLHFTLQNLHTMTESTTVSLKRGLTNYTFQHLKPGTSYRLEVSATAGPYRVEGSKVMAYTYPMKPTNLSLNSYGKSNTLKASWNSSVGEREFYLVLLQEGESRVPIRNMSVGGNTTQLTFHNLSPGSLYTLWVTAVAGSYKASAKSISAWTYPLPLKHLSLSNKGKSTKSLQASWQIPPGERGRYIGTVMETKSQLEVTNVTVEMSKQRTNITFEGLLPGRQYTLKMVGVAGPHQSLVQTVSNWTYPLVPSGVTLVSSRWSSRLFASWEIPPGDRDQFFLRFYSQEHPLLQRNVTIGPGKQNFTFEDLLPGTQYFLEVSALAGPYRASSQVVSAWTYPLSLSNVSVKCGQSPQQLIVSWMESGRGREYWVQLYSEESLSIIQNVSVPHGTTQVTLDNLVPGTRYRVEIVSRAGPHYISSQTAIGYTVPLMPLSLIVTSQISSVLNVQWKAPTGQRDRYMVSVSEEGATDTKRHVAVEKANTNTTIMGLAPGTCYFIAVWSLAGPYSSASRNDTACTPPAPPVNLTLKNLANSSVLYTAWAKPPGGRDHYRMILYSLLPPGLERIREVGPDSQDFLWTGLPAGSQFAVQVTAVKGQAEASSTIAVAWTSPLPVTFVKTWTEKRPGRLSVSWVPTSGRLDSYELNLYPSEPIATALHTSLGKDATNFTFSGLIPGTKYLYEIASRAGPTRSSSGNFSAWTSPLPPHIVHLSNKGYTDKLNAFWEPTAGGHDGYVLTLYYTGSGTVAAKASVAKGVTNFTFTGLIPGSEYFLEVASTAGPHRIPARNVSDWTYPSVPRKLSIKSDKRNPAMSVTWGKPLSKPEHCQLQLWLSGNKTVLQRHTLVQWEIQHVFQGLVPGRNYSVSLSCTAGPYENSSEMMALPIEPTQVKDLQCLPDATSVFLNWTIPEGDIEAYELTVRKFSKGGLQKSRRLLAVSRADATLTELTSNTAYQISVSAIGKNGMKGPVVALGCNTSVEVLPPPVQVDTPQFDDSSRVIISPDMFSEDNGLIEYYGVVVTTNESLLRPTQDIISRTWYDHYYGHEDSYLALLLPNPFHLNESTSPKIWPVTVGAEECSQSRETCNGKLKTDAQYRFSIAAFTRYSQRTPKVSFTSFSAADASAASAASPNISAPVVSGIIVGFLATVTAIAGWICWRHLRARRMEKGNMPQEMITYSLRNTHRPIPLQSFRQYYEARAANSNNGFFQDFEELKEVGKDQPKTVAELPANTSKNRYPHVLPYDYSRVKLSLMDEEPHSDYINANFVPGYNSPQEFIATQGPLKKTVDDFWRLVWEQHICTIVMLTVGMENGRVLCEYYWPSDSSPFCSGQIKIHLLAQNFADEWTTREFRIQHEGLNMERRVIHLHYTAWSNHGVPDSTASLNAFIELVRAHMQSASETGPTLVHGSAGVGRTGTFIALDRLLQQLKHEKVVDVFNTIYSLRMNRHRMIETLGQYIFIHSCILEKISEEPLLDQSGLELLHPIPLKNFVQHHAKNCSKANAGFLREYEMLLEAAKEEVNSVLPFSGSQPIGLESSKIFYDRSKVKFSPLDRDPFSDLSHVWFIPGCNSVKDYIAIEGPDKLALEEFWGLIWEYGVHTIITLLPGQMNCPAPDNSCWPSESDPVCTERLTIQQGPKKVISGWPCIQLRLKYEKKAKERVLQRFQFPLAEGEELPDPEILVGFLTMVRQLVPYRKRTSPVVLHCSLGGLGQMGMLIALDTLLQQLKEEKNVDIYGVVLRLVRNCCLMTPTLDRYIYLYDCIRDTIIQKQV